MEPILRLLLVSFIMVCLGWLLSIFRFPQKSWHVWGWPIIATFILLVFNFIFNAISAYFGKPLMTIGIIPLVVFWISYDVFLVKKWENSPEYKRLKNIAKLKESNSTTDKNPSLYLKFRKGVLSFKDLCMSLLKSYFSKFKQGCIFIYRRAKKLSKRKVSIVVSGVYFILFYATRHIKAWDHYGRYQDIRRYSMKEFEQVLKVTKKKEYLIRTKEIYVMGIQFDEAIYELLQISATVCAAYIVLRSILYFLKMYKSELRGE